MQSGNIQDLFRLQTENVDLKVNMAVNTAIDRVVEQIRGLKEEMHAFRHDVNVRFSSLENRVIAVETKLGIIGEKRKGWYNRFMDQVFKTSWAWLGLVFAYLIVHLK